MRREKEVSSTTWRRRHPAHAPLDALEGSVPAGVARGLVAGGALLTAGSAFLSWTWTPVFPGNLTVDGYPGGLQWLTAATGVVLLLFTASVGVEALGGLTPAGSTRPIRLLAVAAAATTWFTLVSITVELGGLTNLTAGGWCAAASVLPGLYGAFALPGDHHPASQPAGRTAVWRERMAVTAAVAAAFGVFVYAIDTTDPETFGGFLIAGGCTAAALNTAGLSVRISRLLGRHRPLAACLALAAAVGFTLTQSADHNANIAANILIFATVALGLNIVVGLTGLLDLGYVAFLGVGAYTAALVSGSAFSAIHVQFPFWAAALAGAMASLVFGVVIGAPTLRLRGDYLAIVTLGFGEIFRIVVQNLDGTSGPSLTNGPNGIAGIPDLELFGFDFGQPHQIGSATLGRFANYYLLMLVVTAFVVTVFIRAANSQVGRSWVALREDETAAEAMGINGFRAKLTAFALGAALAGLAGTVSAHVTYTVVPSPYVFAGSTPPNSAFLLAAVILGGMGTVSGPLLGAALLYLIPEKLQFLHNYQLLTFGVALIIMMRLRPEGIIAGTRQRLEWHEAGPDAATNLEQPAAGAGNTMSSTEGARAQS
jgi:branched-chain amino acid transport system permease protein